MQAERKFYEILRILIEEDHEIKEKADIKFYDDKFIIKYDGFTFNNGDIFYNNYLLAKDRTPEQCYIFLRSIIL